MTQIKTLEDYPDEIARDIESRVKPASYYHEAAMKILRDPIERAKVAAEEEWCRTNKDQDKHWWEQPQCVGRERARKMQSRRPHIYPNWMDI